MGPMGPYKVLSMRKTKKKIVKAGGSGAYRAARMLQGGQTLGDGWSRPLKPIHTTGPLTRLRRRPGKGGRGTYAIYRTLSAGSDPAKWQHPGIRAHNLMDKVSSKIPDIVAEIV